MPHRTRLASLVEAQVQASTDAVLLRTIDHLAEEMAVSLMQEPGYRAEMLALVRLAFRRALESLNEPTPSPLV